MEQDSVQDSTRYVISGVHHGAVWPGGRHEMIRDVFLLPAADVRGGIGWSNLVVHGPNIQVDESVYCRRDLSIDRDRDFKGSTSAPVTFRSCVACRGYLRVESSGFRVRFISDLYVDQANLCQCFIYGNLYAREAILRDSVVLGGVFTRGKLEVERSCVGTFRAQRAVLGEGVSLFFPYAIADDSIKLSHPIQVLTFFSLYQRSKAPSGDLAFLESQDIVQLRKEDGGTFQCLSLAERILDGHPVHEHLTFNRRFLEHLNLGDNLDPALRDHDFNRPLAELEESLWKLLRAKKKATRRKGLSIQELFERFYPGTTEGATDRAYGT